MGTVTQLRPCVAVFDARVAAAACEAQLSRLALFAGLAIIGITTPDGRASVTAEDLASRLGFSRPSMVRAIRAMEDRELGIRPKTTGGKVLPVFCWSIERLPSLLVARIEAPTVEARATSRELWQEVFSARYRKRFGRETSAGWISGIVPAAWPRDAGWEVLCEWSERRSRELGESERWIVECACDAFFSFGDKVDAKLAGALYPLGFAPRLIGAIDRAVVSRLTTKIPSVRKREAEPEINDGADAAPAPSMAEVERMIAEAAARKAL